MPTPRLAVPFALAGVLLTSLPFLATSAAAGCPSWTDAYPDATTGQLPDPGGVIGDDNLDIVKATFATTEDTLVAAITVKKLNATASDLGDEYHMSFTVAGQDIDLFADRDATVFGVGGPFGSSAGFVNSDGDVTPAQATWTTATNTVTITGKVSDLKTAVGADVAGKAITGISAETTDTLAGGGILLLPYDAAAAPAGTTLTVGTPCGGGGGGGGGTPTPPPPTGGSLPGDLGPDPLPAAGCNHVTDGKSDGTPSVATVSGTPVGFPNDPALDITSATLSGTVASVMAYITTDALATTTKNGNGPRFELNFTANGKVVNLYTQIPDAVAQQAIDAQDVALNVFPNTGGKIGGTYEPKLKVTGQFDLPHKLVRLSVTTASLTDVVGDIAGKTFTAVTFVSKAVTPTGGNMTADTAPNTGNISWVVGDNKCFGPPAGKLTNAGKNSVQYGDAAAVAAKLTTADGKPAAGRKVTFAIGGASASATTGADGVARASLKPSGTAGPYTMNVSFAGDSTVGKVELPVPFSITPEATKLTLSVVKSGSKRTVTAKLLEDDGRALAGQTIAWTINGKSAGTSKTSSAGTAVLATAKPTQTVVATFTAVTGKYAGSKATLRV